jgi:hypothetical protein
VARKEASTGPSFFFTLVMIVLFVFALERSYWLYGKYCAGQDRSGFSRVETSQWMIHTGSVEPKDAGLIDLQTARALTVHAGSRFSFFARSLQTAIDEHDQFEHIEEFSDETLNDRL